MEIWQRTFITKNLPSLIENIECSTLLLSHFLSGGIFSNEDVDRLITIGKSTGKHEQTRVFLDMLTCRSGGFEYLARTLFTCNRTGASLTLLKGVEEHFPGTNPFLKCGININYEHLLQKRVYFGGVELALLEICGLLNHDDIHALLNKLMNVDLYKKLSSESQVTLVKQTIPSNIPYYISRSLYFDNELDTTAFELDTRFAVQDITSFELKNIVQITSQEDVILIGKSSSQLQIPIAKFIILETPDHFEKLAKNSDKPIYWIRYYDGKLLHVKSSGNGATTLIRSFLKKYRTTTCEQDGFLKMCLEAPRCLPILIYDSPGTGKSTLFACLANQLKQSYQNRNVLFVRMSDLLQFLVLAGGLATKKSLKDFLLEITTSGLTRFEKEIQSVLLDSQNHKIELFLDGLDELQEEGIGISKLMLELIQNEISNIRIWLTSRLNRKDELEELFGVTGYRIVPFQNIDQVNFLENYWQSENGIIYSDGLHNLAIQCLEAFKAKVSKTERDFAGIPLQCKLLANICTEYALRENRYFSEEEFTVNSIHSMYKKYVNKQLETGNFQENLRYHTQQALQLIFPNVIAISERTLNLKRLYKMSIIEPKYDGNPTFVHQTFADYFVAEYVLNFLQTGKSEVNILGSPLQFVFQEVLKHHKATQSINHKGNAVSTKRFTHSNIAHFLESGMLDYYLYQKDIPNLARSFKSEDFYNTAFFFDLLNCCLEMNLVNLFAYIVFLYSLPKCGTAEIQTSQREIFLNHFGDKKNNSRIFSADFDLASVDYWEVLLLVSCRYSSITLLKYTSDLVQIAKNTSYYEIDFKYWLMTPMSVATNRGNFEVVAFLLQLGKNQFEIWDCPIHECIYNSFNDSDNVVDEKINILKQLQLAKPDIFELIKNGKDYPLLVENIHFRLIKFLVENGAKMSKSRKGSNVAHLAATYFSADDFHELVLLAHSLNYSKIFKKWNKGGFTPFHLALKYIELRPDTIETLGSLVSAPVIPFWGNSYAYVAFTLLAFAIEGRRTTKVFNSILTTYKRFAVSTTFEHNLLCLCLCFNNLNALKFFLDKGLKINNTCEFKTQTLLSHAMLCNDEFRDDAIRFLIDNGVNVNRVFLQQDFAYARGCADYISFRFISPLRYAEKQKLGHDIISLLKSKGAGHKKIQCICYSILLCIFMVFTNPFGVNNYKNGKQKSFTRYFSNKLFIMGSISSIIVIVSQILIRIGDMNDNST